MSPSQLQKIMFLDVETVPVTASFEDLPGNLASLWEDKFSLMRNRFPEKYTEQTTPAQAFETSAGIYSEFGKIVCISVGLLHFKNNKMKFRVKSFAGDDERVILTDFAALVTKFCTSNEHTLCGHNIKEFDVPYICRRMLINNVPLPEVLQLSGKKPWEIPLIDTLDLWKFGDYKNYTSLKLLTAVLGIPTPKDDIDGSMVAQVYYREKDIERIAKYCQKDVLATAQVLLRLKSHPLIDEAEVEML